MSVTIDTLEIQIESNSSKASQGIDALALSLGKLKENGKIGTAVKNLNNLTSALKSFTSVSSNANKISGLADALQKLKNVGSMKGTGTAVEKMAASLKSLTGVNTVALERIANSGPLFERVAAALGKMSGVKSGGLGTMVNALDKISDVTKKLDDKAIDAFADRVAKLNEKLTPLSTKMTTIQAGLRGVNSEAKKAGNGVGDFGKKIDKTALNTASFVTIMQGLIQALRPVINLLSDCVAQALEWDGVAARFGRGFGAQAQETYDWIKQLNEEMGINTQQFMQYSSVYATMLTGFGVAQEDASKMALGYTELTYDIWAGYNDVYKSFDEAAEAVKSAIAGEVEPVRRAGFTIVQSTLEQTAANHGLEISLEKATEAQKSYLRYLTLVDQAHAQNLVGTYAKEMNTAEGMVRTFTQQLKSLKQAFGSLLLPALVRIMPWLQAFVDLLTEAVFTVASFFGVEIQKVDWSGFGDIGTDASNAKDSIEGANKEIGKTNKELEDLKNATLGIDELNIISPPSGSVGDAGGAGGSGDGSGWGDLDVDSLWNESIFDGIQSKVGEIKQKLKDWMPVIELVGAALAGLGIAKLLGNLGDALSQMKLLEKISASIALLTVEAALVFVFADSYLESGNLLYLIGEALVTAASGYLMFKTWGASGAVLALGVSILAQLVALEMNLADGTVSLSSPETWIQGITTTLMGAFGGAIISRYTGFFAKEGFVIGLAVTAALTLVAIRMGAIESGEISSDSVEAWIMEIGSVITSGLAGKWLGAALYTKGGPMGALIGVTAGLVLNLVGTISVKGEDFGNEISDWINAALTAGMTAFTATKIWKVAGPIVTSALKGVIPKIGTALSGALTGGWTTITGALAAIPVWGWIVAAVVGILALAIADYDFTDVGKKVGEAIGWAFMNLTPVGLVIKIGKWLYDAVVGAIDWCRENISWDKIVSFVTALFKKETWTEIIWPKVKEIGKSIWDGLWGGIADGAKNLWGNITEFANGFFEGFKEAFDINSPSKKMMEIGKDILAGLVQPLSVSAIKDKISGMWNSAKNWWNGKKGLEKAEVGVSLVKKGWSTVKGWIGSIPGVSQAVSLAKKGWSSIKNWIGSIPSLAQKIGLTKSGWSTVKKWIGTISPASQAIKLAKSGWSKVSTWIGSMPTLSAKIKLVKSGWSSIKNWLGNLNFNLGFKLPKIGVNWGKKKVAGFEIKYPNGFYTYAKGGFPDLGEMFIAREAGPEMVGRIGNRTTVANNDQIVEGISEGVYAAVVAAMKAGENSGGQSVNVYLDGKQIYSSMEQRKKERGASILGNQVYAY